MGAWGVGPYDNDVALDFLGDLAERSGEPLGVSDLVVVDFSYDFSEGFEIYAAAALVAWRCGLSWYAPDEQFQDSLKPRVWPPAEHVQAAISAVEALCRYAPDVEEPGNDQDFAIDWLRQMHQLLAALRSLDVDQLAVEPADEEYLNTRRAVRPHGWRWWRFWWR